MYNQADYFVSLRKTSSTILLHHLKSLNALQNRDPSISLTSFAKFNFVCYHIKGPLANEIFALHKHFKKSTKKYELPPLYYKLSMKTNYAFLHCTFCTLDQITLSKELWGKNVVQRFLEIPQTTDLPLYSNILFFVNRKIDHFLKRSTLDH